MAKARPSDNFSREAASDDEEAPFALSSWLNTQCMTGLDPNWFLPLKRLQKLSRLVADAQKNSPGKQSWFLADTNLSDWIPPWVGIDLEASAKKALIKDWETCLRDAKHSSKCIACLTCFWYSHAAAEAVSFPAVLIHLQLLNKLASERALSFVLSYSRTLMAKIRRHIKEDGSRNVDSYLIHLDLEIVHDIDLRSSRKQPPPPRIEPEAKRKQRRLGGGRDEKPPPTKKADTSNLPSQRNSSAGAARASAASAKKADSEKDLVNGRICFWHAPHLKKVCSKKECTMLHLDTMKEDLKVRYERALTSYGGANKPK